MCLVTFLIIATVQKVFSAIFNSQFFGSQSQAVLPGTHPSEAPHPGSCSVPQCSWVCQAPQLPVTPSVKSTWCTLAKSLGKKTLYKNWVINQVDNTETYSLLC